MQYNCGGFNKNDEFTNLLLEKKTDIKLLNETWITKSNERIKLQNNTHTVVAVSATEITIMHSLKIEETVAKAMEGLQF